ncbi:MAG: hypothetical protein QOF61_1931 [Acidobacteriota bacterium]|jgi:hypothetical protein|nr:hypothetical protein [Acidobacteriota bacterium]
MMRKLLTVLFMLALVSGSAEAQQKRGPSTPEERKRAVEIAELLENDPLNKDAKKLSEQLLFFLIEVPDIHVTICTDVLGNYSKIKGDYAPTITAQLTFSEAKFVIEHPDQSNDDYQVYLAGVEGVLRTYQNIKKAKPKVEIKPLEELLVKQQAGQLNDFVKSAMGGCKSKT